MNKLASETSPYLLQHKNNPVDWYPWGEEALQKAITEDKIIILSIGYSACHWCHVMEHECFEDQEVASVMNTFFVNIKVDREERPDIDGIYMDALQNMGLRGGWPLNVFLLPNKKPFYGGTYFPKRNWINLLYGIQESFKEKRQALEESADGFAESLQTRESEKYTFGIDSTDSTYTEEDITLISEKITQDFDTEQGGMRRAPKFPMPSVWNMVLNLSNKLGKETLITQLKETLDRICLGGIFDHLAGGWTRYSTDERWKVPHFEKMLYDNGQLMALYSKSFLFFNSRGMFSESLELYKWAVELTVDWLRNEIIAESGGFYSALDADSEGEEGKYYVWKLNEIREVLGSDADKFCVLYDISEAGNWEHHNNVLHLEAKPSDWALVIECNQKLLEARQPRIRPGLDNKIICGWNGLMLTGLIEAYKVFGLGIDLIDRNINFIEKNLLSEYFNENNDRAYGLRHLSGVKDAPAFLDDYAAIIEAFLNYYQISFEEKWIFYAHGLTKYVLANFYDTEDQLFYFTDSEGEKLIARKKEIFDNVIPASNSAMVKNLYVLGRILGENEFINLAKHIFSKLKPLTLRDPQWLSNWTDLGLMISSEEVEVVAYGTGYKESLKAIQKSIFNANTLFFGADSSSDLKVFKGRMDKPETLKIYICVNHACHLPVSNVEDALKLLIQ